MAVIGGILCNLVRGLYCTGSAGEFFLPPPPTLLPTPLALWLGCVGRGWVGWERERGSLSDRTGREKRGRRENGGVEREREVGVGVGEEGTRERGK